MYVRILRAGLFERVSTEEQSRFGYSIKAQKEALEEYCGNNKIKIVDHYCDEGVSGGKPYTKRPEMKRLLDDVEAGKIDLVLFTRLDRWFRNVSEYFKVQEILDRHKVEWKAIWEDYDTTTSNGRMAITIFLAIAQNEREKTAERIRSVFESKRRNKESFFGANSTPFGYVEAPDESGVTRLIKDPELAPAMQEFWDLAVTYENINKAAKTVNLKYGISRSKSKWYELSKKEVYTGTYKGVEDYCPAYVSREDWLKLNRKDKIKQTQNDRIYLFTGLIRCPVCGGSMASKYTRRKLNDGTHKEYYHYKCQNRDIRNCENSHTVAQLKAENWLLDNLDKLIQDEISRVEIERNKPKPKPKTNIANLKEQLRRLEVVYRSGNKSDDAYIKEAKEINDAIVQAENEVPTTDADKDISHLKEMLETDFRTIYNTLYDEEKRRFWRGILKEIHVEGNEVVSVSFS